MMISGDIGVGADVGVSADAIFVLLIVAVVDDCSLLLLLSLAAFSRIIDPTIF